MCNATALLATRTVGRMYNDPNDNTKTPAVITDDVNDDPTTDPDAWLILIQSYFLGLDHRTYRCHDNERNPTPKSCTVTHHSVSSTPHVIKVIAKLSPKTR